MNKPTPYEQSQIYKFEIEAWHLFYESFKESSDAILISRAVLIRMYSEITKAKQLNPKSEKIKESEIRVNTLNSNLDLFEKLNTRCVQLQSKVKSLVTDNLKLSDENEKLSKIIEQLKSNINL